MPSGPRKNRLYFTPDESQAAQALGERSGDITYTYANPKKNGRKTYHVHSTYLPTATLSDQDQQLARRLQRQPSTPITKGYSITHRIERRLRNTEEPSSPPSRWYGQVLEVEETSEEELARLFG